MMSKVRIVVLILLLSSILVACSGQLYAAWKPPFLPLELTITDRGELTVSTEASAITPFGEFSFGYQVPLNQDNQLELIIRDRNKPPDKVDTIYIIQVDQAVDVTLNGQTHVSVSNKMVVIDITSGGVDSIELKPRADGSTAASPSTSATCGNDPLPPRLQIGGRGRVMCYPPLHNLLRHQPTTSAKAFARIEIGHTFSVLQGPVCGEDRVWWRVESYKGNVGWTAESGLGDDGYHYFAEPTTSNMAIACTG